MAVQLQIVFSDVEKKINKLKIIKDTIKQVLEDDEEYSSLMDKIKNTKLKADQAKFRILEKLSSEALEIEELKSDLKDDKTLLNDKAVADYLNGKDITVIDKKGFIYEPVLIIKYKKSKKKQAYDEDFFSR
ncbi:hypothetical protein EOL99_04430 [Candidatus Falkowbacteria bacterium]|nr:hypothetical protein [Candidatus Falkowbacteria bacterium]